MQTLLVDHPVLADILTRIRDQGTDDAQFASLVGRATTLMMVEATTQLATLEVNVTSPVAQTSGRVLAHQPLLLPVLRAGLAMLDAARAVLPEAPVGFVGLRRDESTATAHWYLRSLPADLTETDVIILEPMVATGGTLIQVVAEVAQRGARSVTIVSLICSDDGLRVLDADEHAHLVRVIAAAKDPALTDQFFISPGLGDAGDRSFGWS